MFARKQRATTFVRTRYDGPYAMNPRDPRDFFLKLFLNALLWECIRALIVRAVRVVLPKRENEDEATRNVRAEAPKQYTGAVHAIVVTVLAGIILRRVLTETTEWTDAYYQRQLGVGLTKSTRDLIERTNWLFLGYLVQDTARVLMEFKRLRRVDMVAHHVVFMVASVLSGASQTMMLPFAWLLLGEASTPLLTLRWTIQSAAYSLGSEKVVRVAKFFGFRGAHVESPKNAGKQLEFYSGLVLVLTFFLVRVVAYTLGYTHMLMMRVKGAIDPVPASVAVTLNVLVGAGAGLNAHWFSIMIRKAMRGAPNADKKAIE